MPRIELEVLPGLEEIAEEEVGGPLVLEVDDPAPLLDLRTVVAAHLVRTHAVPRPKALLDDARLAELLADVALARRTSTEPFTAIRFGAAGADSPVFRRLGEVLARRTGLPHRQRDGDLLIRVRPGDGGWQTLVRLTPRPLATRSWRVRNHPAALNATIAAAMVHLARVGPHDRIVNLLCGSGSLLAEAGGGIGVDVDAGALALAAENLAGVRAPLVHADATRLPLRAGSVQVLLADLPYGHRSGSHEANEALHPLVLSAAAELGAADARFVVITHELRRFERALRAQRAWRLERELQVFQKGHHPKIWLLHRSR